MARRLFCLAQDIIKPNVKLSFNGTSDKSQWSLRQNKINFIDEN